MSTSVLDLQPHSQAPEFYSSGLWAMNGLGNVNKNAGTFINVMCWSV